MQGKASHLLRLIAPVALVLSLMMLVTPSALASRRHQLAPVGPKSFYLALGDSLAFGYQPDFNWAKEIGRASCRARV